MASSVGAALFAREYPHIAGVPFGRLLVWQAPIYLTWALVVPLIAWATGAVRSVWASIGVHALLGPALVTAHALFASWWIDWDHPRPLVPPASGLAPGWFATRAPIDILMYCFIAGALYARQQAWGLAEERTRRERLEKDLARSDFNALTERLQPHFLFNALQSIAVLIGREPATATRMIQDLAVLLRATLYRRGIALVPLSQEIDLLAHYLAIEQVRFADRLRILFEIEPEAGACLVPSLLLQPLVENAIRHGLTPHDGGEVTIAARCANGRLLIEVRDDGVGYEPDSETGMGLGLTRERLVDLYSSDHVLTLRRTAPGTTVAIEIPAQGPK